MTQTIKPGEFFLLTDNAVIRTKCPQDQITNEMIAQRCRAARLSAGDTVLVQCFDHAKEVVLAWATYMITAMVERKKHLQVDDVVSRSFVESNYEVECIVDWRTPAALIEPEPVERIQDMERGEKFIPTECQRIWNPRSRMHEVRRLDNGELIHSDKDQETASRIAAGELPIPEPA